MHAEVLPCKVYGEARRGREEPRQLCVSWTLPAEPALRGLGTRGTPAPLPVTTTRGHQGRRIPSVLGVVEKTFPLFS